MWSLLMPEDVRRNLPFVIVTRFVDKYMRGVDQAGRPWRCKLALSFCLRYKTHTSYWLSPGLHLQALALLLL
jgi:hypothetical protein